jgi:diguanylate cyclase (GGDEF)-like protein
MAAGDRPAPTRVPILLAALVVTAAGALGWLFAPAAAGAPEAPAVGDATVIVAAQQAAIRIFAAYAVLENTAEIAGEVGASAVVAAAEDLNAAFLAALEGVPAVEAGSGTGVEETLWVSVLDSLLVAGFEESRSLTTLARSWTGGELPGSEARMEALHPVGRVVTELRTVVFDAEVVAVEAQRGIAPPAEADSLPLVTIAGLVVVILAGLLVVVFSLRGTRAVAAGAGSTPAGRPPSARYADTAGAIGSTIMSDTDPITGATGRSAFERTLRGEVSRTQRYSHQLSMLMFSVDQIRAEEGIESADYILGTIGEIVQHNIRVSDVFSRVSDNLFAVLLTETPLRGAERVAEKLRRNVEVFPFDDVPACTVSIGISGFKADDDGAALLRRAEAAANTAVHNGGNTVVSV